MIGGSRLHLFDAVKNYDQREIFAHMGFDVVSSRIRNPFRLDRNPKCYFSQTPTWLYFVDLAMPRKTLNCLEALTIYLKNDSLSNALAYIFENFTPKEEVTYTPVSDDIEIKIVTEAWDGYFEDINVSDQDLEKENVFKVKEYWCNTRTDKILRRNRFGNKFTIAYHFPKTNHTKLYFPGEDLRFYTNCNALDVWGEECINNPTSDTLIITKSGKDYLTLKYNYPYDVIAVQSETTQLLLKPKHRRIFVLFDNDFAGITNSYHLPYKRIILPEIDLFSKDPYDYFQVLGKEKFGEMLKECI